MIRVNEKKFSFLKGLKQSWDRSGEEAKRKKEVKRKQKVERPRGYLPRLLGRVAFWVMFIFMFGVVLLTITAPDSSSAEPAYEQQIEENEATSQAAVQYALDFSRDYFNWSLEDGGLDEREERLSRYLASGLDPQAGLQTTGLNWNSTTGSVKLIDIVEKSDQTAHITVQVQTELQRTYTEEETRIEKNDDDEEEEVVEEVERTEQQSLNKYFVVPVAYENGSFGVYELPQFTSVDRQTTIEASGPEGLSNYDGDESTIQEFLDTFFSSYAEDDTDRLSYMMTDNADIAGLTGSMIYQELSNVNVQQNEDGEIIAFADVSMSEPETNIAFNSRYSVVIKEQDGRQMVQELNRY